MPGKVIATPNLSGAVTNGRPGFAFQWWPDVGLARPPAPVIPPGAHWNGSQNGYTAFLSRGMPTNTNSAVPGNHVSTVK